MALPSDLISQFVKETNNSKKESNEATVYATVVYNGKPYVKLDGSDLLTPISTTADVKDGERVTVMIKNHTATVTGNISSPSARTADVKEIGSKISEFDIVMAYKITTEDLEAANATIENLRAKVANFTSIEAVTAEINKLQAKFASLEYVSATDVDALNADIENLQASFATITDLTTEDLEALNADIANLKGYTADFTYVSADVLDAIKASIKELDAKKLSAESADLKYANIDFANIGEAAIKAFYAKSGVIQDVIISDGQVTGKLVGVTIKGDLIEGGTVVADKLVIQGENGLYYKLNVDSLGETTASADPKYQKGIDGSVLVAKSITAEQIAVDDLVAFDATIGGFNMTKDAIYSGVKESADNPTRGIYLDNEGQLSVGDTTNYLKYYKDQDGNYKLEISSASIDDARSSATNQIEASSESLRIELKGAIDDAVKNCVKTSHYDEDSEDDRAHGYDRFYEDVKAQLNFTAEQLKLTFAASEAEPMQNQLNEIAKYFTFDDNGLTIGQTDSKYKVVIDNDRYSMQVNGIEIMYIANGEVYTPKLTVLEKLQLLGLQFELDDNYNLNCDWIGIPLEITVQPQSVTYTDPGRHKVTFSIGATGIGLSYYWQEYSETDKTWNNISGANEYSYVATITCSADDAKFYKYYRCVVTDADGNEQASSTAYFLYDP